MLAGLDDVACKNAAAPQVAKVVGAEPVIGGARMKRVAVAEIEIARGLTDPEIEPARGAIDDPAVTRRRIGIGKEELPFLLAAEKPN